MRRGVRLAGVAVAMLVAPPVPIAQPAVGERSVTLIHIGDIHGHLVPRPDALGRPGRTVGGVARIATVVERIRRDRDARERR